MLPDELRALLVTLDSNNKEDAIKEIEELLNNTDSNEAVLINAAKRLSYLLENEDIDIVAEKEKGSPFE